MTPRFVIDRTWVRTSGGHGVLAGSPASYFGVTAEGGRVLDALERGDDLPPGHESLTGRMLRAGAIHPIPRSSVRPEEVTVVIPVHARDDAAVARVAALVGQLDPLTAVVVDDASSAPAARTIDATTRLKVVRLATNGGPAAARNAALPHVSTPVVVFVDDDVHVTVDAILLLSSVIIDGQCAVAAPRVACAPVDSAVGEYEEHHSPLDMGAHPALVRAGGRVPYVPSAVMACSTDALRALGGFSDSMRTGEDVDLVWRMSANGHACRYIPSVVALHQPRPNVRGLAAQRFAYGTSAALLDSAHPRSVAPFRAHILMAVPGASLLGGFPLIAVPSALVAIAWFAFSIRSVPLSMLATWRLAITAMVHTTRLLASAIRRSWWPLSLVLAAFSRPALVALVVSVFAPAAWDAWRSRPRRVLSHLALRVVDDVSYGTGVWRGAVTARSLRCLLPVVSVRRTGAR